MTVHSAKGLEFDAVFITGLEEGLFPHENSLDGSRRPRGGAAADVRRDHARAEAALPHVRADRMLHGQTRYNVPSRFFDEIPAELMRKTKGGARAMSGMYGGAGRGYAGNVPVQPGFNGSDSGMPWRIGQSVTHPKFGAGVIVSAEGRGADARVQVNFRNSGLKWLMLEYAKLAPA